ncbi:hypothetical protein PIB30_072904, partial [Stylosanthes scabra]|nr:hypothetical protein [Stylosanthes scabra]
MVEFGLVSKEFSVFEDLRKVMENFASADPAGIESALHRVDSQGFVWDKMSFQVLGVNSRNLRVDSKLDRGQILLPNLSENRLYPFIVDSPE